MFALESFVFVHQAGRLREFWKLGRINAGIMPPFVFLNWRSRSTFASLEPLLSRWSSRRIFSVVGLCCCTCPSRLIPKRPSPCSKFANESLVDKVNPNNMNTNSVQYIILFPFPSPPREPAAEDSMVSFRDCNSAEIFKDCRL